MRLALGAFDLEPARVLPLVVPQVRVARPRDGHDDRLPCRARLGRDAEQHLLAGLAAQQLADLGDLGGRDAVDVRDEVAHLDVDAGPAKRRQLVGQIGIARVDVRDAVAAGRGVAGRSRPERCRRDVVFARPLVAAVDEDVQRRQLAHHLGQDVGELGAIGDAIHQRRVLRAHGRPVHAVHLAVVEVVALEAPGFGEHLTPLVARVEPELPVASGQHLLGQLGCGRRLGGGVEHEVVLLAPHQHLLAVGRQLVAPHVVEERLELGLVRVDGQRLERALGLRFGVAVDACRGAWHPTDRLL